MGAAEAAYPAAHPPVQVAGDGEVGALGGGHPQVGGAGVKDDLRQVLREQHGRRSQGIQSAQREGSRWHS